MDDAAHVRVVERVGDLAHDPAYFVDRLARLVGEERGEIPPRHEGHDEIGDPLALADVVNRHDVRMRELRRGLRLTREAPADGWIVGQLGGQYLDRDDPVEAEVARAVDDGHPAASDLPLERVLLSDRRDHTFIEIHQGPQARLKTVWRR